MRKFRLDNEAKKILKNFSVFFGIIFGMCVILVVFTLLARNSWRAGLAVEVQKVLDSYSEAQFTVGKYVDLNSNLSTGTAVYSLIKKDSHKASKYYGVIVRIPSILGPVPAVFIYSQENGVTFAGYAVDNGRAEITVSMPIISNVMNYWEAMIPKIIEKTGNN